MNFSSALNFIMTSKEIHVTNMENSVEEGIFETSHTKTKVTKGTIFNHQYSRNNIS